MKNRLKTVLLLGALSGMLVGLGAALGGGFLHASLAMAALLNLGAWFFSDRIVLAMSRARELPPDEALSRSREYLADQSGAGLSGDPEGLARALEKLQAGASRLPSHADPATASLFIVNPLAGRGGILSLFSTHPPLAERIRRLRAMTATYAHG